MTDCVVTVPKTFTYDLAPGCVGLAAWAAEGDLPGEPWSGQEWDFTTWGHVPDIQPGERVYVVCQGKLRGYAPLVRLLTTPAQSRNGAGRLTFVRGGGAVAVTIEREIIGFRGWRYPWWDRAEEMPFPSWLEEATLAAAPKEMCESKGHRSAARAAAWCATWLAPGGHGAPIAHRHLCTMHLNSEKRRGRPIVVPIEKCSMRQAGAK